MKKKKKFYFTLFFCIFSLLLLLLLLYFLFGKLEETDTTPQQETYNNTTGVSEENTNHTKTDTQKENTMNKKIPSYDSIREKDTHPDRVEYADGFYYEPITVSVKQRIYGLSYKEDCTIPYEDLRYLSVLHYDFNGNVRSGKIICNKIIAEDLIEIFYELYENKYEIDKIRLVDEYNADDDLSCADNNTSCFNYRTIAGSTNLSNHAKGLAIDINPFQNPYITYPNGVERISPEGSEIYADRNSGLAHMITEEDLCYKLFTEHGFSWGGHWKSIKDYQHFEKE